MGEPRARNVTISDKTIHVIERPAEDEDLGPYTYPGTQYKAVDLDKDKKPDLLCEMLTFYEPPDATSNISRNDKGCVIFDEKYRLQATSYLGSRTLATRLGNEDQRKRTHQMFDVVPGALALFDRFKSVVESGRRDFFQQGTFMGSPTIKMIFENNEVFVDSNSITMFARPEGSKFQYTGYHMESPLFLQPIQAQLKSLESSRHILGQVLMAIESLLNVFKR